MSFNIYFAVSNWMPNSFSKELSLNYFSINLSDYWNLNYAIKECYPSEQSCFWIIKLYVSMTNIAIEASNLATHSSVLAWRIPGIRGAWWAAVYGVAQSRTWLKQLSSSSSSNLQFNQLENLQFYHCYKEPQDICSRNDNRVQVYSDLAKHSKFFIII